MEVDEEDNVPNFKTPLVSKINDLPQHILEEIKTTKGNLAPNTALQLECFLLKLKENSHIFQNPSIPNEEHTRSIIQATKSFKADVLKHFKIDSNDMHITQEVNPPKAPSQLPTHNETKSSLQVWKSLSKHEGNEGVFIHHTEIKKLLDQLEEDNIKLSQHQPVQPLNKPNTSLDILLTKFNNLESKINNHICQLPPLNPPPTQNSCWDGTQNTRLFSMNKNNKPASNTQHQKIYSSAIRTPHVPVPTNSFINQFKPSFFIIRKIPNTSPFDTMNCSTITQKINEVLSTISATLPDNTPIRIKGTTILKSGDFKFFTQNRIMATWLLDHKHEWTHLCDPLLVTRPKIFPILLHSVPVSFKPEDRDHLSNLCQTNNMNPLSISNIRWLGNPTEKNKIHGSIVINFLDQSLATQIEKGGLFLDSLFMKAAHYIKTPTQCFNCLEIGHTAKSCKNDPLCSKCGEKHNSQDCNQFETDSIKCYKCINTFKNNNPEKSKELDEDDLRFRHSPRGNLCPQKNQFKQKSKNLIIDLYQ